jgi:ribosomal subunit interface protein
MYLAKEDLVANLLNPEIAVLEQALEDSPEVKSYVYQQIAEFEPYITPQTIVAVILKDPLKLALQYEAAGKDVDPQELKSLYRISISLREDEAKISAEGVDKDIFTAIRMAKDELLKKLMAIQDNVESQKERNMAIHHAMQNTMIH